MSLYLEAASILQSPQTTSLKSIIYNPSRPFKSPQAKLYALIVETLKFQGILKEVVENAGILKLERKLTPLLSILLAHDLLFTRSGIAASNGPLKDAILRHKARLNAEFTRARIRRNHPDVKSLVDAVNAEHGRESEDGVSTTPSGLTTFNPRWIRANTLRTSIRGILESHTFREFNEVSGISDMFFFGNVQKHYCQQRELLPDIFAIHPSHNVVASELYTSGAIILQSAASCLPAIMLNPPVGATVLDGCAAPGNKTTHLAALVGATGRVFAVEKDKNRGEILEKMIKRAGADKIVRVYKRTDFTTIGEGHEAWRAKYLLLDPSCSGSGILQRIDWDISNISLPSAPGQTPKSSLKRKRGELGEDNSIVPPDEQQQSIAAGEDLQRASTKERLQSLTDFQLAVILHAFSFPDATRITYSTCSIHAEENEHVVVRALSSDLARSRGWTVQSREENPLATWNRRGLFEELSGLNVGDAERQRIADGCIRVSRTDSLGGGFFVACFVRNVSDAVNTKVDDTNSAVNVGPPFEEVDLLSGKVVDGEWEGISDAETDGSVFAEASGKGSTASSKKKKKKEKRQRRVAQDKAANAATRRRDEKRKTGKGWS